MSDALLWNMGVDLKELQRGVVRFNPTELGEATEMSGGAFDYVEHKIEDERVFEALPDLKRMERFLRDEGLHDAANEIQKFILVIETAWGRLRTHAAHVKDLVHAAEWYASGDWSADGIERVFDDIMQGKE